MNLENNAFNALHQATEPLKQLEVDRATFERRNRITRRQEFVQIFRTGKRITGKYYRIYYILQPNHQTDTPPIPRIGISVSKAVGKAVRRNYEKRIVREFFRANRNHIAPYDFIIQRKPGIETDFHQQWYELKRSLIIKHDLKKSK